MTALTLTTTREVSPEEVDDLIELIDFSRSPWFKDITTIIPGTSYLVNSDGIGSEAPTLRTQLSSQAVLDAVTSSQKQLCCQSSLTGGEFYGDTLGYLCANDADIILQTAIFGRIVFG